MNKNIFTFYRDGEPVAELHLVLGRSGLSVADWMWHGDPKVQKVMKGLPNNSYSLGDSWHCRIMDASERAGLTFTARHEGDQWATR